MLGHVLSYLFCVFISKEANNHSIPIKITSCQDSFKNRSEGCQENPRDRIRASFSTNKTPKLVHPITSTCVFLTSISPPCVQYRQISCCLNKKKKLYLILLKINKKISFFFLSLYGQSSNIVRLL